MTHINFHPSRTELRWFGGLLIPFAALVAWWVHHKTGSVPGAMAIMAVGGSAGLAGVISPPLLRLVYVAWMIAVFPIGWVVTHIILAIVFYLVVTPLAVIMKLVGRDPMARKFDKEAATYWIARDTHRSTERYFRQY